jgi:hypothetical protein
MRATSSTRRHRGQHWRAVASPAAGAVELIVIEKVLVAQRQAKTPPDAQILFEKSS